MKRLMKTTEYKVTCLSPAHVGTGEQFGRFDGFAADKKWRLIDLDRVVERGGDATALAEAMKDDDFSWRSWLKQRNIPHAEVAVYALTCWQDPGDTQIREAIKSVYHQPYLPGSSVKGAIRTALLWRLLTSDDAAKHRLADYLKLAINAPQIARAVRELAESEKADWSNSDIHRRAISEVLGVGAEEAERLAGQLRVSIGKNRIGPEEIGDFLRSDRFVAQPLEKDLLGADPLTDLLKTIHVVDSAPVEINQLVVGETATFSLRNNKLARKEEWGKDYRVFAEMFMPRAELRMSVGVNEYLFSEHASGDLPFTPAQKNAVEDLAGCCNDYARAVFAEEKDFYTRYQLAEMVRDYARLEDEMANLPPGAFLLNVGWGGGWEIKTVGDVVREALSAAEFRQLRQRYQLGRRPDDDRIDLDAHFPHSRQLAFSGGVARALGWLKFEPQR